VRGFSHEKKKKKDKWGGRKKDSKRVAPITSKRTHMKKTRTEDIHMYPDQKKYQQGQRKTGHNKEEKKKKTKRPTLT